MALYTRRVRVRKSRNGRIRKTYGSWSRAAKIFNRAKSETAISRTIFKTSYVSTQDLTEYSPPRDCTVLHVGCAGLLFSDQRWVMFKTQFDEFRIVGIKYIITCMTADNTPIQIVTSFDRSAAITANFNHYITYQENEQDAQLEVNNRNAINLILGNPSCRESLGNSNILNTQVISIFPVTPMEKQWIGTAFVQPRADQPLVTPTFMSAFNPKLSIGVLAVDPPAALESVNILVSTELYIETRGSKMRQ